MANVTGTTYIGVTSNLIRRVYEHKSDLIEGFTKKHQCHKLVYFEHYEHTDYAIKREKEIKKWRREKKENLISKMNILWKDLYDDLLN